MLRIECPFCGLRNHDEFTYLEDGSGEMPALDNIDGEAWYEAVFLRDNPRGMHIEDWHHTQGCRMVLRVSRNTLTHQILSVVPAHPDYKEMFSDSAKSANSAPKSAKAKSAKDGRG